jgi:uncharacterized repeat protein (TIGR03847 family)
MDQFSLDLNPTEHVTVDAIGQPGSRVFYIQGWRSADPQPVTIIIEKIQLLSLAVGIEQLLAELGKQKAELATAEAEVEAEKMRIHPPVDPLFRAGEVGIGYDADHDQVVILAREAVMEVEESQKGGEVRFWCTRQQASRLAAWGREVVNRGRPLCPQCGQPMEPEGHFCPKKNGHKH